MRLSHAHALLKDHGTPDNAKHFKMLFTQDGAEFTPDSALSSYVDFVALQTDTWLLDFPESLKSLTAVSKPKTAFLKMLTIPSVMSHLGAQRCFDVADKVSDSYRKLAKQISDERQTSAVVTAAPPSETVMTEVDVDVGAAVETELELESDNDAPAPAYMSIQQPLGRDTFTTCASGQARANARIKHGGDAVSSSSRSKAPQKPMKEQFASLVRVVRDLSIMLDDVLSERSHAQQ